MDLSSVRTRYLVAMGLVAGCRSSVSAAPAKPDASAPTPSSVAPPARQTVARAPCADGGYYPVPRKLTEEALRQRPTDMCASGAFCEIAPATLVGDPAAVPFGACPSKVEDPLLTPEKRAAGIASDLRISFSPSLTESERKAHSNVCCYEWLAPCPGGRTLRDGAQGIVAEAIASEAWLPSACDETARDPSLAAAWAREAAFEHASVASFNLAIVDWMELGAPSSLIEEAQRAALDELVHARALYGLASAAAGVSIGPGRLPPRSASPPATFERVARETLLDACVNECIASVVARARAQAATADPVQNALLQIAADEERHAELGWKVLAWLLSAGGDEVRLAVSEALASLDGWPAPTAGVVAPDRGFLPCSSLAELQAAVLSEVVVPCARALLA